MKKLGIIVVVSCSFWLAGCTSDESEKSPSKSLEEQATIIEEEDVEALKALEKKPKEEQTITTEQAQEVVEKVENTAQEKGIIEKLETKEEEDTVHISLRFSPKATDKERGEFIFNYTLFLQKQYPDKEIVFDDVQQEKK